MRYDRHDRRDDGARERYEKALTMGDLCQAIEQRRIPSLRKGDEYIARVVDARALHERLLDGDLEITPGDDISSLEVGRPA